MKFEIGIIFWGFVWGKYMFFLLGICCMSYFICIYLILYVLIYWCIYKIKKKLIVLLLNLVKLLYKYLLRNCVVMGYIFCCLKFIGEKIYIYFKYEVLI